MGKVEVLIRILFLFLQGSGNVATTFRLKENWEG